VEIMDAFFKFRSIDRGAFIKTRILNRDCSGDCQKLCTAEVFACETIWLVVADREETEGVLGGHQRNAKP
jgi:hypothetical protein